MRLKQLSRIAFLSLLMGALGKSALAGPVFFALNVSQATPPDVSALSAIEDTKTSLLLFWTSGGGTTASYRISYQSGATAPADCTTGTQISEATVGANTNYIVSGLTAGTKYSFRICAANSSGSYATGVSVTMTTPAAQPIFRSVGYNQTSAKATGAANAMTISGSVATFASGLATNIGVGDAIQYSTANNATMDKVVFIHGRISSTQFLVKTAAAATPTAVSSNTTWGLYRAYTNINNAVSGTENSGLNAAISNFDSWSGGTNLVTAGANWYIECYADAAHTNSVATVGTGWTTSASNKVYITTPWDPRHVGTRQRHLGIWSTSYFNATVANDNVIVVNVSNVVVEGLQLQTTVSNATDWVGPVMIGGGVNVPASSVLEVNQNILVTQNSSGAYRDISGIYGGGVSNGFKLYATNNVIICIGGTGTECNNAVRGSWTNNDNAAWTAYVYNNTIAGKWQYGVDFFQSGSGKRTLYVTNNIVQGSKYEAFTDLGSSMPYGAGSGYNVTDYSISTALPGDKVNTVVSFVNAAGKDYHLSSSDTGAKNAGTDLSSNINYPFTLDIDGTTRSGTWDAGADEY